MSEHRPAQPPTPAADAFTIRTDRVDDEISLAYVREGVGGYPLLLIHGYPETKRVWWRNIEPLAEAGYEVIVPDLRGFGDSDLSPSDRYDLGLYASDLYTLVHDVLGHDAVGLVAGDLGAVVALDLIVRYPGWVDRLVFFNTAVPPVLDDLDSFLERGLPLDPLPEGPTGDYRVRQGRDPEQLLAELDTPERRRRYIRDCYEHRLWASPGSFDDESIAFMTEPFADADRLAASWACYQLAYDRETHVEPMLGHRIDIPTLVLYGPDDQVVPKDFPDRCELVFSDRVGPLVVPRCGHFLQWERADVLNSLSILFFAALRDV